MNGNLIDREALKKAVYAEFGNSNLTDAFNDIIDNAPTVETDMDFAKECYAVGYEDGNTERPQGDFAEKLKERITESVCKYCPTNNKCVLCEISRVFSIIALTDKETKGGAENDT